MLRIALLCAFASMAFAIGQFGMPIGGWQSGEMSVEKLTHVLSTSTNMGAEIKEVTSVSVQVVNGINYAVDFVTKNDENCSATWLETLGSKVVGDVLVECN